MKNGWELLDAMPEPRNYHTASLVGDDVFIVGELDVLPVKFSLTYGELHLKSWSGESAPKSSDLPPQNGK